MIQNIGISDAEMMPYPSIVYTQGSLQYEEFIQIIHFVFNGKKEKEWQID